MPTRTDRLCLGVQNLPLASLKPVGAAAKTLPKIQRSMDSCRHATEVALRFAFGKANPSMWHVAGHVHAGKETQIFQEIDDWKNWGFAPCFAESALLELSTADLQEGHEPNWLDAALLGSTGIQNFPGLSNPCQTSTTLILKGVKYTRNQYVILSPTCACQVQAAVQTTDTNFFLLVEMLKPIQLTPKYRTRWQRQKVNALVKSEDLNKSIRVMYYRIEDDRTVSLLS